MTCILRSPHFRWRWPLCALGLCPHVPASDETGCWGQCTICTHRAGFVDRATLSAYIDGEIARELAAREHSE